MSDVIMSVEGQIRGVRELRRKDDHSVVFGRAVSVLTGSGSQLGDTQEITVFNTDHPAGASIAAGNYIHWAVAVSSNGKYPGVRAVYRENLGAELEDLSHLSSSQADAAHMHAA